jgi:hypothetical protein
VLWCPPTYWTYIASSFTGSKEARAWNWSRIPTWCRSQEELYLHSPCVFMALFNYLSTGNILKDAFLVSYIILFKTKWWQWIMNQEHWRNTRGKIVWPSPKRVAGEAEMNHETLDRFTLHLRQYIFPSPPTIRSKVQSNKLRKSTWNVPWLFCDSSGEFLSGIFRYITKTMDKPVENC